jgi:glycosyltransferase involved in cell wall biosynthesis
VSPRVSIVIATYNRHRVLAHAIESMLRSTFHDWEALVIGDGCTGETATTVAAFADPRISFENLPRNSGGQATPNNRGVESARGEYIAFLNNDDLYLPHHLAACVETLDRGDVDLVWAPALVVREVSAPGGDPVARCELAGVPGGEGYTPFAFYVASSWMMRRDLPARVGPWPHEDAVFVTPSQAWLFRAWRSGARLRFISRVGVVSLYSGDRPGSYARPDSADHDLVARWLHEEPERLARMIEDAAIHGARASVHGMFLTPMKAVLRGLAHPAYRLVQMRGLHPLSVNMMLWYGGRGGSIRKHRRITGA